MSYAKRGTSLGLSLVHSLTIMNRLTSRTILALVAAPMALGLAVPASAQLFHRHSSPKPKHHGFLHRAAAGVGAYEVAKHTGNRRAAHGGKRNVLQRHPVLTGLGAYKVSKHRLHH